MALPWLGDEPLEVGSGSGDYAATLADLGLRPTASEHDRRRLDRLEQRFADDDRVRVRRLRAPVEETGTYSAVVAFNVLEHIEDDVGALASFRGLVRPGGHVAMLVPAFELAYADFDREVGHVRRYRRGQLADRFDAAGLQVIRAHYVNAPGLLGWLLMVKLLKGRPGDGLALRMFERVVPALAALEARVPPPFGQSVFVVGRR